MTERIAVLDGDLIAYRCAAANETRSIRVTHKVTGQQTEYAHRTAFKENIKGLFDATEFVIEDVQRPEELRYAYHAMRTTIEGLCKSCGTDDYEVYISGSTNFRDDLPLPTKYKSSREGGIRPLQLKDCRDYLVKHHGAVAAVDKEADDILAQRCYEGIKAGVETVACTIDGDQNGVAGWMYNWNKMREPKLVKGLGYIELVKDNKDFDGYGRKFFFAQWALGDSTDCFKPCEIAGKKFGVVAMYNLLKDCTTDKECVEAVYQQYKKWYPGVVTYKCWKGDLQVTDAIGLMDLYAACAHMRRFEGDVFDTEKLLKTLGIEYERHIRTLHIHMQKPVPARNLLRTHDQRRRCNLLSRNRLHGCLAA